MKKSLTSAFIVCFLLALSAFRPAGNPSPTLVGTWYFHSIRAVVYLNRVQNAVLTVTNFSFQDSLRYNSNGTGIIAATNTSQLISKGSFTYTRDGGSIITKDQASNDNGVHAMAIISITPTTLYLQGEATDPVSLKTYVVSQYFTKTPVPPVIHPNPRG